MSRLALVPLFFAALVMAQQGPVKKTPETIKAEIETDVIRARLELASSQRRLAALTGRDDANILAIGDGVLTDIAGGIAEGIDTLFVTAGIAAHEFGPDPANPDPKRLNDWLDSLQLTPTHAIPFLA